MTRTATTNDVEDVPHERIAEASVWIARLNGESEKRAIKRGIRQWLQADPANARAFELATEVWDESVNLRRVVPVPEPPRRRPLPRWAWITAATAICASLVGAIMLHMSANIVATGIGEQRQLVLEDGTRIFLNTATRLVVDYDEHARRIELKEGEALFNVARRPDWPFVVEAGTRQVTALGTSFVVRRDSARLVVTLVTGKVSVDPVPVDLAALFPKPAHAPGTGSGASDSNRAELAPVASGGVVLAPGQRLTVASGEPPHIDTSSVEESTAWRGGQVVLRNRPLSDAVQEMNRYSTRKLVVEDPDARRLEINGLFQAGDSASFANAVAHAHGLGVVERDGEIVLVGRPSN